MTYSARYPSPDLYPAQHGIYPITPTALPDGDAWLMGSNGTAVALLAVTGMTGSRNSNTTIRPTKNGDTALVDIATWDARTHTLTILLPDYATYRYIEDLYRSGAAVTLIDPGNPWDGTVTISAGTIDYRAIPRPGSPARIEMTIEVAEQ
ncbi:hypothetical protein [Actinomyces provencensis]|uniref:hypothetical protein n=1 Tax=Actinomyces provencensis TaxID=1720198 RepID=UPI00096A2F5F|nr:hypothetical protein [Actinomyces provencensis]